MNLEFSGVSVFFDFGGFEDGAGLVTVSEFQTIDYTLDNLGTFGVDSDKLGSIVPGSEGSTDYAGAPLVPLANTPSSITQISLVPITPLPKQQLSCGPDGYRDATPEERAKILAQAKTWEGTPYKYGGDSRSGIDCSHLVCQSINGSGVTQFSYSETKDIPTNPSLRSLDPNQLTAGDVLLYVGHAGFYDPNPKIKGRTTYSARSVGVTEGDPAWYGKSQAFRVRVKCR